MELGKTTTIKLILGLQQFDKGEVIINGYDIKKDFEKAIEKVGAIVENPDVYMYLTGYKNLELDARLYKDISKTRIDEIVKLVGLDARIKDKVQKYSLGMRQRLGIARALLNKPKLLILDEPTNGLDPEGIKELRTLLKELAEKEKMSILISSHNLAELDTLCTKVCIIKNGEIIEETEIEDLKEKIRDGKVKFIINDTNNIKEILKEEKVNIVNKEIFEVQATREEIAKIVKILVTNNVSVYGIEEEKVSLEDAFLKKTGGNKIG